MVQEFRNLLSAYPHLLDAIKTDGRLCSPRGKRVIEHTAPIVWHLRKPQEWVLAIPNRRVNPFFALAEVVWMWSGKGGAEFITYYNKSMSQFLDDGVPYFHGAYGKRVRHAGYHERPFRELPYPITVGQEPVPVEVDQLGFVVKKLQEDPSTRQAVVSLWDPIKDNFVQSKDHPCNNMLYFSQRDGALNMTIAIRSNDLIWGVPYNMIQFSHLQALVAGTLGLEVGKFHVMAANLHYYTDLYKPTLESVVGWSMNINVRGVDLEQVSGTLFSDSWDMRWTLDGFDLFVSKAWEPLEYQLRKQAEMFAEAEDVQSNSAEAFFQSLRGMLTDQLERFDVPDYWCHVFNVMFMYHCRKAGAKTVYTDIYNTLPTAMRWAINDFDKKEASFG